MRCFIVMQQSEFYDQKEKGIIQCPQKAYGRNVPHYFSRMTEVKKGDCFFHYQNGHIVAIGIAKDTVFEVINYSDKTPLFEIPVTYYELENTLHIRSHWKEIVRLLPSEYSPFQYNGQDNEGFLYPCNENFSTFILEKIGLLNIDEELFELIINTEAKISSKIRIGHQEFKRKLIDLWDHKCAICGISLVPILRASHAKPWKDSNNNERLDPYNGLLLCAHHDALFDKGFITVNRNGIIVISSKLKKDNYKLYHLCEGKRINIFEENKTYFSWHNSYVFKK